MKYDECRLLGHAWDRAAPIQWRGMIDNTLHVRCVRCHAWRHDSFDVMGNLTVRSYEYPSDYAMTREERPTRAELRLRMRMSVKVKPKTKSKPKAATTQLSRHTRVGRLKAHA